MRNFAILALALSSLAACDPVAVNRAGNGAKEPEISCLTRPGCAFDQSPLRVLDEPVLLPNRPYKFFPTATPLNFVDAQGTTWQAPQRTLTDGASIPRIFVSVVGDPTSPEFINAAAVHDAYCGVGNEQGPMFQKAYWQDVHVMFYDGLIVGGTEPIVAKIMFAAVWLGGPRWADPRGGVVSTQGVVKDPAGKYINPLSHVPDWRLKSAMYRVRHYIRGSDPNLPQLIDYLWQVERDLLAEDIGDKETYITGDNSEKEVRYDPEYTYEPEYEEEVDDDELVEPVPDAPKPDPETTEPDVGTTGDSAEPDVAGTETTADTSPDAEVILLGSGEVPDSI